MQGFSNEICHTRIRLLAGEFGGDIRINQISLHNWISRPASRSRSKSILRPILVQIYQEVVAGLSGLDELRKCIVPFWLNMGYECFSFHRSKYLGYFSFYDIGEWGL